LLNPRTGAAVRGHRTTSYSGHAPQEDASDRLRARFEERAMQWDKERAECRQKIDALLTEGQRAKREARRTACIEEPVARMAMC
jgi:hypothetical protein